MENRALILYKDNTEIKNAISCIASQLVSDNRVEGYAALVLLNGGERFFNETSEVLIDTYGQSFQTVVKIPLKSYAGVNSTGAIRGMEQLKALDGMDNIIVFDDVLDTGHTLESVLGYLKNDDERTVYSCVLFAKDRAGAEERVPCDYCGMHIEDKFVVGFGLDCDGHYRELDELYVYSPENQIE